MSLSQRALIPPPAMDKVLRPIRVVLADDSPAFVEVLSACLAMENCLEIVGVATDGAEAIQQASELDPDLVLMDVHMPYLNGFEAAMLLSRQMPDVTIVLMSTDDSPRLRAEARACGAHGFIPKSRLTTDLLTRLEEARSRL